MILGHSELKKLIKKNNLITGLSKRDQIDPEGCVYDLQLDKVFELKGKAFLGIEERETPEMIEVATYNSKKKSSFIFKPGKYYMTKTIEEVNIPDNVVGIIKPRSTTFRCGLILRGGVIQPGYKGQMFYGMYNAGPINVEIELGARYAQIIFQEVKGKAVNTYRGQWQGGRATTKGKEKQI
jgi:deoxycytidine triphosphate deaminase